MFTPDAADGPILVTLTYQVTEDNAVAFTEACATSAVPAGEPEPCAGNCSETVANPLGSSSPT